MNISAGAIIIAIVGVLGTLGAAIIGQLLSARARREDFEIQRSRQQEDYIHQRQEAELANKRSSYIAIIASSRTYRIELMNYLYMVKHETVDSTARSDLHEARRIWLANFSEVQIVATLQVLSTIEPVGTGLAKAYRATKHLEAGEPGPDESFEEIDRYLSGLWDHWGNMREAMRRDLGVAD